LIEGEEKEEDKAKEEETKEGEKMFDRRREPPQVSTVEYQCFLTRR
jgi:hypothetical protein